MNLIYGLLLSFLTAAAPHKDATRLKIGIVYYNQLDRDLKKQLVSNITETYNCTVTEIDGIRKVPDNAYYKPRGRYRADGLLVDLGSIAGLDKVIAITSKDISSTKGNIYDWGIIGLGSCPGKCCVISTYRIKTSNKVLFNDRLIKAAIHELGHTMGLPHCTYNDSCVMSAGDGTAKSLDSENRTFCSHCLQLLSLLNTH